MGVPAGQFGGVPPTTGGRTGGGYHPSFQQDGGWTMDEWQNMGGTTPYDQAFRGGGPSRDEQMEPGDFTDATILDSMGAFNHEAQQAGAPHGFTQSISAWLHSAQVQQALQQGGWQAAALLAGTAFGPLAGLAVKGAQLIWNATHKP
jgi:hypothetical protein